MFYKKINKIIDEHNRFVTNQAINLLDFKNEIEKEYVLEVTDDFEKEFIMNKEDFVCSGVLLKDVKEEENEIRKRAWKKYEVLYNSFNDIRYDIKQNKAPFDNFVANFSPGFYRITNIARNVHCYFYAIKLKYDLDETISLYGIISTVKNPVYINIDPKTYSVKKMTKHEFETEYLTNRIACCEIGNEIELVRYVEELKEFFNKWNTE